MSTATTNTMIASTILQQLGGNKFIAMTGAKHLVALDNGIKFSIGKNASKANTVKITLNGLDLYDVEFIKFTPYSFKIKNDGTFKETLESSKVIATKNDIYSDMLQDIFTSVTGLYTHF